MAAWIVGAGTLYPLTIRLAVTATTGGSVAGAISKLAVEVQQYPMFAFIILIPAAVPWIVVAALAWRRVVAKRRTTAGLGACTGAIAVLVVYTVLYVDLWRSVGDPESGSTSGLGFVSIPTVAFLFMLPMVLVTLVFDRRLRAERART